MPDPNDPTQQQPQLPPWAMQQQAPPQPQQSGGLGALGTALSYAVPALLGGALGARAAGKGSGTLGMLEGAVAGEATAKGVEAKAQESDEQSEAKLELAKSHEDIAEQKNLLTAQGIDIAALRAQNTGELQQQQISHFKALDVQLNAVDSLEQQKIKIQETLAGLKGAQLDLAKRHLGQIDEQIRIAQTNAQMHATLGAVLSGTLLQKQATPISGMITGDDGTADSIGLASQVYGSIRNVPGGTFLMPWPAAAGVAAPPGGTPPPGAPPAPPPTGAPAAPGAAPPPTGPPPGPNPAMIGLTGPAPKKLWNTSGVVNGYRVKVDDKGHVTVLGKAT